MASFELLLPGMVSGFIQTAIGHPLDTMKTVSQCGGRACTKTLWSGITFNLLSSVTCNGVVFGTKQASDRCLANWRHVVPVNSFFAEYVAPGAVSGAVVTPFVFFFEIGKTKKQVLRRKLSWRDFLQRRGFVSTLSREIWAFSTYFSVYKLARDDCGAPPFWAGGAAGMVCWMVVYPLDTTRNRQIAYNISFAEAASRGHLYRGLGICLCRAFFVNSFGFLAYEETRKLLHRGRY